MFWRNLVPVSDVMGFGMRRALIVIAALLAACGRNAPRHPNVLVVTFDTLRTDAVGPDTPAIRAFLAEATLFSSARTVVPLTLPSHVSMFTGLFPVRHGIHDNANEPIPSRDKRSFPLLAEQFRDAGYATAGFASNAVVAPPTGIAAGFDAYDCPASENDWPEAGGAVPGEERVRAPIAWIEGVAPGKPWFVWVHLFDPHAPYLPFAGDDRRPATRATDPLDLRYAGDVRRADAAFEKLLREVGEGTVVVIASDHGESLYEHGEPTHGPFCYGTTIDAVLAVRGPGFDRGRVDRGLRSVADIAPTLRRLCNLPAAEGDGKDLLGPPHDTLVAESLFAWGLHGWGQVFSVTDGRYTLVEAGRSLELFDRSNDPGERSPLPFTDPAYEKLDRALERFRGARSWTTGGGDILAAVAPYGELRRSDVGYMSRYENAKLPSPGDHMKEWSALLEVPSLIEICAARRDTQGLQRALRALEEIEKTTKTPLIDHYRAGVCAAIAQVTGDNAKYRDAAWAQLAAIEKGYVQSRTILPAIRYCVAASDPDGIRTLVRLLRRSGKRLDAECQDALDAATKKFDLTETYFSTR
jgi:arylsulfatase A-like enzyme